MTMQQMYDKAKLHLLTQNSRSAERFHCKYRDSRGRKCGAGIFIPDEKYNEGMEGLLWESVNVNFQLHVPHTKFVQEIQQIHDAEKPSYWKQALEILAHKHGLLP